MARISEHMISFLLPTSGTSHKINHVYEEMFQEQLGICHVEGNNVCDR